MFSSAGHLLRSVGENKRLLNGGFEHATGFSGAKCVGSSRMELQSLPYMTCHREDPDNLNCMSRVSDSLREHCSPIRQRLDIAASPICLSAGSPGVG